MEDDNSLGNIETEGWKMITVLDRLRLKDQGCYHLPPFSLNLSKTVIIFHPSPSIYPRLLLSSTLHPQSIQDCYHLPPFTLNLSKTVIIFHPSPSIYPRLLSSSTLHPQSIQDCYHLPPFTLNLSKTVIIFHPSPSI